MHITFVQTGGTIDKDYPKGDRHHGYEFKIAAPAYETILKKVHPSFTFDTCTLLQKDSLDITDADRTELLKKISQLPGERLVVTHGTDTVRATAQVLCAVKNKVIVLTGAMLPEKFYESDADLILVWQWLQYKFRSMGYIYA